MNTIVHQRIVAVVVSGLLLVVILELVRRKRLMERYALLWLVSTVLLLILSAWTGLLNVLASALGVDYAPSALFAVAFGVVLVLLIHFSMAVSRLADQNKVLAQRLGLLQHRLAELERPPDRGDAIARELTEPALVENHAQDDGERAVAGRLGQPIT